MNKIKFFFIPTLLIVLLITSCKQSSSDTNNTNTPARSDSNHTVLVSMDTTHKKESIRIDAFTKSPETDSCSCLYAIDSLLYIGKNYIFAYDLSMIAYMKINGEMTKFTQTEFTGAGKNTLIYFNSSHYQMILESSDVREAGKEKTIQTGSIRVSDKEGNAFITTYYGMCGCFKKTK